MISPIQLLFHWGNNIHFQHLADSISCNILHKPAGRLGEVGRADCFAELSMNHVDLSTLLFNLSSFGVGKYQNLCLLLEELLFLLYSGEPFCLMGVVVYMLLLTANRF